MGNPSIFDHKYESRTFKKYLFLCLNMLAVQLTLLLLAFFIPEVSPPEKVCIQVPSRYLIHLVLRWQKYFCLRAVWEELCIKEEDEYNIREIDSSGISTKGSGEAPLWTVQHCWGCCGFFISQEGVHRLTQQRKSHNLCKSSATISNYGCFWSLVRSVIGIALQFKGKKEHCVQINWAGAMGGWIGAKRSVGFVLMENWTYKLHYLSFQLNSLEFQGKMFVSP